MLRSSGQLITTARENPIYETETNPFSIKATFRKTVITEETIKYAHQQNQSTLVITKETIITPLARDAAREWNIALIIH